ncbi:hypothetical protein E1H18_3579 [Caulobacter sp. RHG1]|nr:hypothetical protein [Caulobacter sp. RHG1]
MRSARDGRKPSSNFRIRMSMTLAERCRFRATADAITFRSQGF